VAFASSSVPVAPFGRGAIAHRAHQAPEVALPHIRMRRRPVHTEELVQINHTIQGTNPSLIGCRLCPECDSNPLENSRKRRSLKTDYQRVSQVILMATYLSVSFTMSRSKPRLVLKAWNTFSQLTRTQLRRLLYFHYQYNDAGAPVRSR